MTLSNMQKADIGLEWVRVCSRQDLVAHSGVVALWQGVQIALFHVPGQGEDKVYAVQNRDPRSGANVIGRGLIGTLAGRLVVTAPLYKQHFDLEQGICVEAPEQRLQVWAARLNGEDVELRAR